MISVLLGVSLLAFTALTAYLATRFVSSLCDDLVSLEDREFEIAIDKIGEAKALGHRQLGQWIHPHVRDEVIDRLRREGYTVAESGYCQMITVSWRLD